MIKKEQLTSKFAIAAMLALAVFLGIQEFKQLASQKKIEAQKQSLQEQADTFTKKNRDLNESLQYLNSPNFKERVARQQLNLKKDGETVYSFADASGSESVSNSSETKDGNFKSWWNYFFKAN